MIISRQHNRSNHPDLFLNGKKISEVDNHTHLGITICNTLSWSVHINKAIAKADRRLNIICRCQKILPRSCKEMLQKTTIRPGNIIYDACLKSESDAIEKCQRKAAFICTGAFRHTSNERLLNELGWEKMESHRVIHRLTLFYKIYRLLTPPYLRDIVIWSRIIRMHTTSGITTGFLYLLFEESNFRNPFIRKQYVNGTTCRWKQKNLIVYTFSKKN